MKKELSVEEVRSFLKTVPAKSAAKTSGVHFQSIYNFRHGLMPSMRTFMKLKKYAEEHLKDQSNDLDADQATVQPAIPQAS